MGKAKLLFGVSQESILGPILLIISLSDLFPVVQNVNFASYVDNNTIYDAGAIFMRSYFPCKNLLKNFLNGSLIIK